MASYNPAMPALNPILILKTGSTHPHIRERFGDFEHWIAAGLHAGGATVSVHDARIGLAPPAHNTLAGVVITGSHAMVSEREPWSEALVPWLRTAVACECPTLGICYGHQLLAHALGGHVAHHPDGVEIGTVCVQRMGNAGTDPLLGELPESFDAQAVHWQSVQQLPPGAELLARSEHEAHHAFRIGRNTWGVQFHPEFSDQALGAYLDVLGSSLAQEDRDAAQIRANLRPTPAAASLLPRFARIALGWSASAMVGC